MRIVREMKSRDFESRALDLVESMSIAERSRLALFLRLQALASSDRSLHRLAREVERLIPNTATVIPLRTRLVASRGASVADEQVVKAVAEADESLDVIDREMFRRRTADAPAASAETLKRIRNVANGLNVAADEYEFLSEGAA
jgi:hypothetical protein